MISSGVFYRWGFYAPDGPALDEVSKLVDAGKVMYCRLTDIQHAGNTTYADRVKTLLFANHSQAEGGGLRSIRVVRSLNMNITEFKAL